MKAVAQNLIDGEQNLLKNLVHQPLSLIYSQVDFS